MPADQKRLTPIHSVIVIDDEMELAALFKVFLSKEGFGAISFTDPLLAFEYFKDTFDKHSLIITDMRMPGMCGIELAKKIREINVNVKIFLMTAFDIRDLENNPDYKAANIDKLLQKPIHFSDLRDMIKYTLNNLS
ncbi:MAG TPA: response regulator [Candidatus Nitrosocosmicus sp.]|nr:response regulator [Candidatus Nitrosocosmicus sp.]